MSGHIRNPDPQFPDRPQHPDFWVLSDAVNANDDKSETMGVDAILDEYIDHDSATHMAVGRAERVAGNQREVTAFAAVWIDAFVAGCEYMRRRLERQYGTGKSGS